MHWFWNPTGKWYIFFSGFGSDLAYVGALFALFRKVNCHVRNCLRIGHHVPGTPYLACRKHHPTMKDATTEYDIRQAHREVNQNG